MGEIRVADAEREKAVSGGQRHEAARDRHPRGGARAGGARSPSWTKEQTGRRAGGRLPARGAGQGRRARDADPRGRGRTPWPSTAKTSPRPTIAAARRPTLLVQEGRGLRAGRNPQARSRSGRARGPEPRDGQGGPGRGRTDRGRAAGRARSPRQGREGHDRGRRRGRGRASAASRPRAKPPPSSPSSKPRPAASTKSWPRRAKACKQIVEACGGAQRGLPADDARTPRQPGRERRPRRSRTSSSTRSSSGRTAAQGRPHQHGQLPAQTWPAPCRR